MLIYHKYQNKNEESKAYGKWYGRAVINETVGVEDIAKRMQDSCTVKRSDVLAVLSELGTVMGDLMKESKAVKIPYLGTFKLGMSTLGADSPDKFSVRKHVKKVRVLFRPETHVDAQGNYTQELTHAVRLIEDKDYTSPKDEEEQGDIVNP